MAAYAIVDSHGPVISPPGTAPDKKRYFTVIWYAANFNDANTFCSDAKGGPLHQLASMMKPGGRCVLTRVTTWHDAATAGVNNTYHYWTIYLSTSTTSAPLSFSPTWWTTDITDVFSWDCEIYLNPHAANVAMLYSSGQAATDDLFMIFEGWIDG